MTERLLDPELELTVLVAEGLSNRELGERLGSDEMTVARQVSQILRKLRLRNRVQLAVWAVKQGLY